MGFQCSTEFTREESIALGLGKQPFCLAKDFEVLKCIYFLIGDDSKAFSNPQGQADRYRSQSR